MNIESITKSLPIQLLFRGLIPGVFFVLSFIVGTEGWRRLYFFDLHGQIVEFLMVAVFSGVVVYTVHRSLFYPIIEGLLDWKVEKGCLIRLNTIQRLKRQWTFGGKTPEDGKEKLSQHMTAWNDYLHLQYASAICIGLGALAANCAADVAWNCPMIGICVVLGLSAFVADLRRRRAFVYLEQLVKKDDAVGAKPTVPPPNPS